MTTELKPSIIDANIRLYLHSDGTYNSFPETRTRAEQSVGGEELAKEVHHYVMQMSGHTDPSWESATPKFREGLIRLLHPTGGSTMTPDPEALAKEYEKIEEEISYEHLEDIDCTGRDTKIESMRRLIKNHQELFKEKLENAGMPPQSQRSHNDHRTD